MESKLGTIVILIFIFIAILILFLFGITNPEIKLVPDEPNNEESLKTDDSNLDQDKKDDQKPKILIAYFSRTGENYAVGNIEIGNTEVFANYIKDYTNADMYKIEPEVPYPESYEETQTQALAEKNNNARPNIKNELANFSNYDIIFIGYPIWYEDMPMIIYTFLESYDFSGKTIIPFNTHEGSGNANTYDTIKSKLSSSVVLEGLSIKGQDVRNSQNQINNWLKQLGY